MAKSTAKRSFFSKKLLYTVLLVVVIGGLAAFGAVYYKKYNDLKNKTPEQLQQSQTDSYIKAVSKLYSLPGNEQPTLAVVQDKEATRKQYPALDQAENGDVLLIYKDAKLAILYRPSENKIVKIVPLSEQISIRTVGSETERKAVEKLLTDNKLNFTSGGSAKTSVTGITVVDVKGDKSEQAKNLAAIVKGTVGKLPDGEDQPSDVDLLILIGPAVAPQTEVTP